jgi:hypothetical protein
VSFVASHIGCSERGAKKELDNLININVLQVIARQNCRHARVLRFNKNYDRWGEQSFLNNSSPEGLFRNNTSPLEVNSCSPVEVNNASPVEGNSCSPNKRKYINKIYKENIYREGESNNIYIINYINSQYTPPLSTSINRWIRFKGLGDEQVSALCELVNTEIEKGYTQTAIASVISDCILEGRKKIYFDRLEAKKNNNGYELMSVKSQDVDDFENFLFRGDSGAL